MKADPRELDAQDRTDLAFIASQLGQIASPRNRDAAEQYLRAKKATTEVSTRRNYVYSLRLLDNVTTGRPYFELSRADVQDFMAALCDALGPSSVAAVARDLRTFYRYADPDTMRPLSWWNAWKAPAQRAERRVVTDEEFSALLEAAGTRGNRGATAEDRAMCSLRDQAILWLMRDTGWRGSAIVSLNFDSVEFDTANSAIVRTPPQARRLKIRSYEAYAIRAVPSLKAWMSARPGRPEDPLFPALTSRPVRGARLYFRDVNDMVRRCRLLAGLRRIRPHDFKHTRATEMAKSFTASEMNKALWSPGSNMGRIYEHLNFEDVREKVRREAGADALGGALTKLSPEKVLETAVAAATEKVLEGLRRKGVI